MPLVSRDARIGDTFSRQGQPSTLTISSWASRILLVAAMILQIRAGLTVLPADLVGGDPAAHFTTGVMVHDYIFRAHHLAPMPFARCFYVRYPKMLLGHWPPLFYFLEAVWFSIFGIRIVMAQFLCVFIAVGCAAVLYVRRRAYVAPWRACTLAGLFLASPLVQDQAWQVMSDLLLAGLVFLAMGSLADYLTTGRRRYAIGLAAWASLAILTKGTGWLVLIPVAIAPLITCRPRIYKSWSYWLSVGVTILVSAPFYIGMMVLRLGYPANMGGHLHRLASIFTRLSVPGWTAATLLLASLLAAAWRFRPRKELQPGNTMAAIFALWILTQWLFLTLAPLTQELNRYYLSSLAPALFLLDASLTAIESRLDVIGVRRAALLSLVVYAGLFAVGVPNRLNASTTAFSRALAHIPISRDGEVILVEGNSRAEGAVIAAELERNPYRSSYLLRGSKFLSTADWSGREYALRYRDPAAIRAALSGVGADYILVDTSAAVLDERRLLESALGDPAWRWDKMAQIPLNNSGYRGEVVVYRRGPHGSSYRRPVSVQLGPERGSQQITCGSPEDAALGVR